MFQVQTFVGNLGSNPLQKSHGQRRHSGMKNNGFVGQEKFKLDMNDGYGIWTFRNIFTDVKHN